VQKKKKKWCKKKKSQKGNRTLDYRYDK
jgi:hypothetical protein